MSNNQRYIVKFNNGFYKIFDTEEYKDVSLQYLKVDAIKAAKQLNQKGN